MTQYNIVFEIVWPEAKARKISALRSANSAAEAVAIVESDYKEINVISVEEYKQ